MTQNLFDLGDQYADMLGKGIHLSGEDQEYFIRGRLRDLRANLPKGYIPRRVLDFGCGIGLTSVHLAEMFPNAEVLGVDTAVQAVAYARQKYGRQGLRYEVLNRLESEGLFDICYCNGVFHHIAPDEREQAVRLVYRSLAPGGRFALFENNPLNPGTRMVMKRIPFDRDAVTLYPWETTRLLKAAGFTEILGPRFLFYFPRQLAALRPAEPWLARLLFGAQYYALGVKSTSGQ